MLFIFCLFVVGTAFFEPDYVVYWPKLLEALIGLFELPEDESIAADDHFIDVEDTPGKFFYHLLSMLRFLNLYKSNA